MKTIAFAAALLVAAGFTALAWNEQPAQDAAHNGAQTCKAAG